MTHRFDLGRTLRAVALSLLVGLAVGSPVCAYEAEGQGRLILAFYHADLDWTTWTTLLCDLPETLYTSGDVLALDRHVIQARDTGIDALVQFWYGPDVAGNPAEANLRLLLNTASQHQRSVAVLVDLSSGTLQTTDEVHAALLALRDNHMPHVAYLTLEGRPVVFFLGQGMFSLPAWEAMRNSVDPERKMIWIAEGPSTAPLDVFDGLYLYDVAQNDPLNLLFSHWGSEVRTWNVQHTAFRYWVATVMPGYDNSSISPPGEAVVRPRLDGEYYRDSWAAADASLPDWIVVRSFNEWPTCTQIEPADGYGQAYLTLTNSLVTRYRSPLLPTSTPTPTAVPTLVTATPTPLAEESEPEPTMTPTAALTPTLTLTPSPTRLRLATPTATREVVDGPRWESPSSDEALEATPERPGPSAAGLLPTVTPMPRMPVEGGAPQRCSLLPLVVVAIGVALGYRRGRNRGPVRHGCGGGQP